MILFFSAKWLGSRKPAQSDRKRFKVSIIVAALNEEDVIESRIHNIYQSDYPAELIEVVIVSDGSTDGTDEIVGKLAVDYPGVKLVRNPVQSGRAAAHNLAVSECSGEILVFTDAETVFDKQFINRIAASFISEQPGHNTRSSDSPGHNTRSDACHSGLDPESSEDHDQVNQGTCTGYVSPDSPDSNKKPVGFATGRLVYQNREKSEVTESVGFYWKVELVLRKLESKLGVLAFGSGACLAVRKDLFRQLPPTGDVDFITPLDVVLQGYKCVHVDDAVAYDSLPESDSKEFKARVRMTAKNFHGTIFRWGIRNLFLHPVYSAIIFFHKIARWLTPFFLVGIFICNLFLLDQGVIYQLALGGQALFYLLGFFGLLGVRLPLSGQVYSFLLANLGFLIGVLKALTGRVPKSYTPMNKDE